MKEKVSYGPYMPPYQFVSKTWLLVPWGMTTKGGTDCIFTAPESCSLVIYCNKMGVRRATVICGYKDKY